MKRYFIVFFIANSSHGHATGNTGFITTNGGYINRFETVKQIGAQNRSLTGIALTNIIELTQEEYNTWNQ